MSKENFKDFIIEDLTWWINVKDYPTEINNNQSVECKNWNFEWTKLVSEKWIEEFDNIWGLIQGMTVNSWDIWHITEWVLYKNDENQDNTWWIFIKLNTIPDTFDIVNLKRYITIDWVEYSVNWNTATISDLVSQLDNSIYKTSLFSWWMLLTRIDWNPISYSVEYHPVILMWQVPWNLALTDLPFVWWFFNSDPIATMGWYTLEWGWTSNQANNLAHAVNMLSKANSYWGKKTWIWAIYEWVDIVSRDTWTLCFDINKKSLWYKQYHLTNISTTDVKFCGILINKWKNTDTFTHFNTTYLRYLEFTNSSDTYDIEWTIYSASSTYTPQATFYWFYANNLLWSWSSTKAFSLLIKYDWEPLTHLFLSSWTWTYRYTMSRLTYSKEDYDNYFTFTETWWLDVWWRVDITVWNLSTLIVNVDWWWAFISYEWLKIPIWEDVIWKPTCWTIYNWKIVLWGYPDNDNIVFSQTATPREPLNLLNFTDYSAWGQSISGWDRWEIRWFKVWENWLYVFKDNSVWYSNSEKDSADAWTFNFIFNKITSNWALSQRVITDVQQEIFYLDWNNRAVRRLWYEQNLTTLRDNSISDEIRELLISLPEEQPLACASFKYPNYTLSLTDWTSNTVTYTDWNSYKTNNVHFIYNVYNKSWTRKTWIDNLVVSDKWFLALDNWLIYKEWIWNTTEEWELLSKKYVITNDSKFKRIWYVDIVWRLTPDNLETKSISIDIIIDWIVVETRTISSESNIYDFTERIDMYNDWQYIQFKITHSWLWKAELIDIYINYKSIPSYNKNYF